MTDNKINETIDLNDYKDYINIDYVVALKKQNEIIKPTPEYIKYHNTYTESSENIKKKIKDFEDKLNPTELKQYMEDLEYFGIPKEHRYSLREDQIEKRRKLSELSNKSYFDAITKYGDITTPGYKKYLEELKQQNIINYEKIQKNPPKLLIDIDGKKLELDEYFKLINFDTTKNNNFLINLDNIDLNNIKIN